ncbi:Hypothetical predicted protein [Paramuricea clavata]|uniref:Uncharacterized protein n=1 Tax=Paramuricea clavata TaxID=317549 RepID=A0A6S7LNX0_PARCT|nr:Hypothetical predicted protein [Paramuricea clavata]
MNLTILPGESKNITWIFDDDIFQVGSRTLFFTSSDGLRVGPLGGILLDLQPLIQKDILPEISITKPATLGLNNINQSYDGTYRFTLIATGSVSEFDVRVFIAKQGGNPPANVTWYKGSVPIVTEKEIGILRLPNIGKDDNPPEEPYFKEKAVVSKTFAITCESNGHPSPSYTIIHNDTKIVDQLINPTTGISTQKLSTTENSRSAANKENDGMTVVVWHIVVSLVSGIIIGILLSYIALCSRRKFRCRKRQYNYQSLRVNAASHDAGNRGGNDDDSTYTALNKTRDVENNYQSLT